MQSIKPTYCYIAPEVDGIEQLAELAIDLRWSWNHGGDELWKQIDPNLWEMTQNPWVVLQTASRDRIKQVLADPIFKNKLDELLKNKAALAAEETWFTKNHSQSPLKCIAYFSMEYMLSEALPIYSGGLGNVAGDLLKASSDLGIPLYGIGLLYQQGYFRQLINKSGVQEALYPFNDPAQLPIIPLRLDNGEWLRLEIQFPGYSVWLRTWEAQIGRVKLFLLDSNDPANIAIHRGITSELYGGSSELRLKQELILGIGGWRLLQAKEIHPDVCHLNEGHAAFAILDRAKCFMEKYGQSFEVALNNTRAGNLFTTHTAVAAGFDRFHPSLIEHYLGYYAKEKLKISLQDLLALGRQNPYDQNESFNMAYLAVRGSGMVNGVSQLHCQVSKHVFSSLFPRWPTQEVPISYVTNGVHTPTWDSKQSDDLWTKACGKDRWRGPTENLEKQIRQIPDVDLWQLRTQSLKTLIEYMRKRLYRLLSAADYSPELIEGVKHAFNVNTLTLGFARRFATYKRPNLLLKDPERLIKILTNQDRPVQLLIAGKAHPADEPGKYLIQQWIKFISDNKLQYHVLFLPDYDMHISEEMVQGVDVWVNTPRRPWEACGTSGMKVLVNGGINLSELDGWWAEAYTPEVGWALGDRQDHDEDPVWDSIEADALYNIIEKEVVPKFYTRDKNGVPAAWISMMRESMCQLTPRFSANRMVRQYTENYYIPSADAYQLRSGDKGLLGAEIQKWKNDLNTHWHEIRFGTVNVSKNKSNEYEFKIQVFLGELTPETVKVELYADIGISKNGYIRHEMYLAGKLMGEAGGYEYEAVVGSERPASDYTARIIPNFKDVVVPLEDTHIIWQK